MKKSKIIDDPNYYGFVNELPPKDKRIKHFIKQYKKNGFDDTVTWNLYFVIARFVLPRLKRFREIPMGYPGNLTEKKWDNILEKMIIAFDLMVQDKIVYSKKEEQKITFGLRLFAFWFRHLWT